MSKMQNVLHKVFGSKPEDDLQPKEMLLYSFSGFGQNLVCGLITTYIMVFFTDALLIAPMTVAWIMMGARLFDAFNDPVMGSIVDKTRTRWGKLRPYILFAPIPIGIFTVLCFTNFGLSGTAQIAISTVVYIAWGVLYTISDVPYWGLSSAMTTDTQVRTNMLTVARLLCTAGTGLVTIVVPALTSAGAEGLKGLAKSQAYSSVYLWVAIAIAIVATPIFMLGFFGTKERIEIDHDVKAPSLGHNLKLLFKNKPLLLLILVGVIGSLRLLFVTMGLYFCKYNLDNEALFSIFTMLIVPGGLIASVLTPYLTRKFGKKNVFIVSHIIGGIIGILLYFVGYGETWQTILVFIGIILIGFPSGFSNILTYAMIGDTVDYLDVKTGERAEGICFSMQTFISKIGMAMTAFVGMALLGASAYAPNTAQSESTLNLIFMCITLITGLSTLLCVVPLFFYKFNEKEQKEAIAILEERNAGRRADKEQRRQDKANLEAAAVAAEAGDAGTTSAGPEDPGIEQ